MHADVHVCHRGISEVKTPLPSPLPHFLAHPQTTDDSKAQAFASFLLFKCTTAMWSGKENVILTRGAYGQRQSKITAVSGNVDQSEPDLHFDSQIHAYIPCILIEYIHSRKQQQMLREKHSIRPLKETYQVIQMSGARRK